ncbi:zinc finger protein 454 isoform X5 [Strongylocentrotus purpuratus]|uniref:C2H2-type domain-containing protein n=1 Tax=Strongylocentrotus purpuratus TaxID=7668 RepID=A0A7M7HPK4_STRPU|nr:zinc finger protein 454 isoform X5 [Strongylocentrotus purpuratus]
MTELSNGHKHYSSPQTLKTKMSEENEEYYQVVCIKEEVIEDDWSENDTTNMQLTESGYVSSNQDGNLSVESTNQSIGTLHQKGIETTHDSSRETVLKGGQRDSFDDGNCSLESTVRNARLPQQHLGERGSKDEQGQLIDDGNCSLDSTKLKTRLLHQNLGERELKDEQRQLLDGKVKCVVIRKRGSDSLQTVEIHVEAPVDKSKREDLLNGSSCSCSACNRETRFVETAERNTCTSDPASFEDEGGWITIEKEKEFDDELCEKSNIQYNKQSPQSSVHALNADHNNHRGSCSEEKLIQCLDRDEKPYKCSFCGKAFSIMSNLTQHSRFHTGVKPFECSYCDGRFTEKKNLIKHMKIHTGENKPYECSICNKTFSRYGSLTSHKRTHMGE